MAACCHSCHFWRERPNAAANRGECHRFPPQVIVRTQPPRDWEPTGRAWEQRPEHYWPLVNADQWCGEFQEGE